MIFPKCTKLILNMTNIVIKHNYCTQYKSRIEKWTQVGISDSKLRAY